MIKNTKELFRNLKIKEDILSSSQKKKARSRWFCYFSKMWVHVKKPPFP